MDTDEEILNIALRHHFRYNEYDMATGNVHLQGAKGAAYLQFWQKEGVAILSGLDENNAQALKRALFARRVRVKPSETGEPLTITIRSLKDARRLGSAMDSVLTPGVPAQENLLALPAPEPENALSQQLRKIADRQGFDYSRYGEGYYELSPTGSLPPDGQNKPSMDFLQDTGRLFISYPDGQDATRLLGALKMRNLDALMFEDRESITVKIDSHEALTALDKALTHVRAKNGPTHAGRTS